VDEIHATEYVPMTRAETRKFLHPKIGNDAAALNEQNCRHLWVPGHYSSVQNLAQRGLVTASS
jgi:hypothetical protein